MASRGKSEIRFVRKGCVATVAPSRCRRSELNQAVYQGRGGKHYPRRGWRHDVVRVLWSMKYVRCLRGSKRRSQPGGSGRSDVFGRAVRGRAVVGRLLLYVRALSEPAAGSRPTAMARPEMPKLPSSRGGGAGGARAVDGGGDAFQIDGELSGSAARDGGARTRSWVKVDRGGDCRGLQRSSRVSGCVGGTRGVSRRLRRYASMAWGRSETGTKE